MYGNRCDIAWKAIKSHTDTLQFNECYFVEFLEIVKIGSNYIYPSKKAIQYLIPKSRYMYSMPKLAAEL